MWIRDEKGRIGIAINPQASYGEYVIWFGEIKNKKPILETILCSHITEINLTKKGE